MTELRSEDARKQNSVSLAHTVKSKIVMAWCCGSLSRSLTHIVKAHIELYFTRTHDESKDDHGLVLWFLSGSLAHTVKAHTKLCFTHTHAESKDGHDLELRFPLKII